MSRKISSDYQRVLEEKHKQKDFGHRGYKWFLRVKEMAGLTFSPVRSILDYGCGKGTLGKSLAEDTCYDVRNYDPGVPKFQADPEPADCDRDWETSVLC